MAELSALIGLLTGLISVFTFSHWHQHPGAVAPLEGIGATCRWARASPNASSPTGAPSAHAARGSSKVTDLTLQAAIPLDQAPGCTEERADNFPEPGGPQGGDLSLPEALDAQLTEQAQRRRLSKSELVRLALTAFLQASEGLETPTAPAAAVW